MALRQDPLQYTQLRARRESEVAAAQSRAAGDFEGAGLCPWFLDPPPQEPGSRQGPSRAGRQGVVGDMHLLGRDWWLAGAAGKEDGGGMGLSTTWGLRALQSLPWLERAQISTLPEGRVRPCAAGQGVLSLVLAAEVETPTSDWRWAVTAPLLSAVG